MIPLIMNPEAGPRAGVLIENQLGSAKTTRTLRELSTSILRAKTSITARSVLSNSKIRAFQSKEPSKTCPKTHTAENHSRGCSSLHTRTSKDTRSLTLSRPCSRKYMSPNRGCLALRANTWKISSREQPLSWTVSTIA